MQHKKIINHFKKQDPILVPFLRRIERELAPRPPARYFEALAGDIIGQQLGAKAADAIYVRFASLFPKKKPTARGVLRQDAQALRDRGMSWAKVYALRDLAEKVEKKLVRLETFEKKTDEDVRRELLLVKGIGPWTAEMFLIFTLGRENIFSFGDLALRKGIEKLYKTRSESRIRQIVERWHPYKTYASLALWKAVDGG
jgi:DNA-3-methyladenine glycosylase II